MNVGGSNSNRFNDIKYARPLNGKPGLPVEEQKSLSSREDIRDISSHSEFSPIKVLRKLEEEGKIDQVLLEPYMAASFDREIALRLKREVFDPVVDYARNSGRDVEAVKHDLKLAILNHIDLSQVRLRQEPTEQLAMAA